MASLRLIGTGHLASAVRAQWALRGAQEAAPQAKPIQTQRRIASLTVVAVSASAVSRRRSSRRQDLVTLRAVATEAPPDTIRFRETVGPAISVSETSAEEWTGDTLVLLLPGEGDDNIPILSTVAKSIDEALGGAIGSYIKEESFEAKAGAAAMFPVFGKAVKRVVLVGLGDKEPSREAGAAIGGAIKRLKGGSVGVAHAEGVEAQALVEGLLLGLHADKRFQGTKTPEKDKAPKGPEKVEMLGYSSAEDIEKAGAIAAGVVFARELVNAPANIVDPLNLTAAAADMAQRLGLSSKILDEKECEAMGMGSFLAVSRASNLGARLIHLTYSPGGEVKRKLGIVGKGLTFDSGGYNLKGAGSMIELMKFDMGGSASTLGAAAAIAQLKPKDVEVHFVIATCENMVSGNSGALRPGDIITAMDGTTIEVNNTDAEGRLTLADALLYCQQQGVTEVIDIATLTGACMVALGKDITGMWSNSDELAASLDAASKSTDEKLWRMPLEDGYFEGLKSDFADMKNTGPRFGGAITAALFLQKFIQKEVNWAHLDFCGNDF